MATVSLLVRSKLWVHPASKSMCKPCVSGLVAFSSTVTAPTKQDQANSTQAYTSLFLQEWRKEVKVGPPIANGPSYSVDSGTSEPEVRPQGVGVMATSGKKKDSVFTRTDEKDPPFYYDGEWKDELPDGFGRLSSAKGEDYVGHFVQGKRSGHGQKRNPNGFAYDGMYVDNQPHGFGIARYSNWSVYAGEFVSGTRQGWGRSVGGSGVAKERYWPCGVEDSRSASAPPSRDDVLDKKGRLRKLDVYDGEWMHGARSGLGRMEWKRGDSYSGHWLGGRCEGPGTFTAADGTSWQGTWVQNTLTGDPCIVTLPEGTRYEGFFKLGALGIWSLLTKSSRSHLAPLPTGTGAIFYPNGITYRGDIVDGRRHGQGVGETSEGKVYHDGAWRDDFPQAAATCTDAAEPAP